MQQSKSIAIGVLYALFYYQFFAISEVCIKWLTGEYHIMQIIFIYSFMAVLVVTVPLLVQRKLYLIKSYRLHQHIVRSIYSQMTLVLAVLALKYSELSTFTTITFVIPFLVYFLSHFILGTQIKITILSAITVGFVSAALFVTPSAEEMNIGILYAGLACLCSAMVIIQNKRMVFTETSSAITFWMGMSGVAISVPFLFTSWITPSFMDCMLFLYIGFFRSLGNIFQSQALKYAPAYVVSPFNYTTLVWAVLFGYLIWGDLPATELYIGATLIILSGLYIAYREHLDDKGIRLPIYKHLFSRKPSKA